MKDKKKPNSFKLQNMVYIFFVIVTIGFGLVLLLDKIEKKIGDHIYLELSQSIKVSHEKEIKEKIAYSMKDEMMIYKKQTEHKSEVDFSILEEKNTDVVGWILSLDSEINYPVVKGSDNSYYLTHLFTKEENAKGSIFMDYRNQNDFSSKNTILYGHHMKDGSMFATLTNYKEQAYYDKFPTMILYTPQGDYMIELFAGVIVDGDYESVCFEFEEKKEFETYIAFLKENSSFKSKVPVNFEDRIITLCTCSYEFDNARYTVYGKLTSF